MTAFTNTMENKLLDWLLRGQQIGLNGAGTGLGPANVYVGLFTTNPTDSTSGTEVTGGSYARVTVACSMANWAGTQGAGTTIASSGTGGTTSNNGAITFPAPSANWGTITGMGVFDTSTAGVLMFWSTLTTPKTVNNGDPAPSFPAAALTFQIDD